MLSLTNYIAPVSRHFLVKARRSKQPKHIELQSSNRNCGKEPDCCFQPSSPQHHRAKTYELPTRLANARYLNAISGDQEFGRTLIAT